MGVIRTFPIILFMLFVAVGCEDDSTPSRPKPCWTNLDTLLVSGIRIHDTSDVRLAFEAYIAFVDSTDATFPNDETDWEYMDSVRYALWRGTLYWQVQHSAYSPMMQTRSFNRLVYVDDNGMVVWPWGCI